MCGEWSGERLEIERVVRRGIDRSQPRRVEQREAQAYAIDRALLQRGAEIPRIVVRAAAVGQHAVRVEEAAADDRGIAERLAQPRHLPQPFVGGGCETRVE